MSVGQNHSCKDEIPARLTEDEPVLPVLPSPEVSLHRHGWNSVNPDGKHPAQKQET